MNIVSYVSRIFSSELSFMVLENQEGSVSQECVFEVFPFSKGKRAVLWRNRPDFLAVRSVTSELNLRIVPMMGQVSLFDQGGRTSYYNPQL